MACAWWVQEEPANQAHGMPALCGEAQMTDRELLEMAAKAAGLKIHTKAQAERDAIMDPEKASLWLACGTTAWNPITDDGDALRLAVKIGISKTLLLEVGCGGVDCEFQRCTAQAFYSHDGDPYAATRRAIVRAAAEIGKAM